MGADIRWVDNLLSRHDLPGILRGRQGVQRSISDQGLLAIELTRLLSQKLGLSVGQSVAIARSVLGARLSGSVRVEIAPALSLVVDLPVLEERLRAQVLQAMESVSRVPRGRPRRRAVP
jgi:hypothetical protein